MMDDKQKMLQEEMKADPQTAATVAAAILQTLQAAGNMNSTEKTGSQKNPEPQTIDLIGLFFAIIEKFWLVLLCAVVGAAFFTWRARGSVTTYTATSKLYIVDTSSGSINIANLQMGNLLTMDYQEVFKTWEVHEMVIEELELPFTYPYMQGILNVTNPEDTRVLYINVRYPDAKMAADIANAYAKAAKTFIINTMRGEEPSDFSIALEPSIGYTVSKSSQTMMGFMLGSVLAVGVLTLLYVLDNRPRSPEDIEKYGGIPTLAVFPSKPKQKKKAENVSFSVAPSTTTSMPALRIANFPENDFISHEAMNTLCTNLSYCTANVKKILVTSRYAGEGKSYVSMNLMRTLTKLGRRVVLVDTDLRASGIQAEYQLRYSTEKHNGLSEYLSGHCGVHEVLYQTDIPGAYMIPAGHMAPNPLHLLDTKNMESLVDWLQGQFDVVILDTPPVNVLVDAVALAKFCDGALLVVGYRKGNRSELAEAVKNLNQTGCRVLGAVLNGVKFRTLSNRHYYYRSERYSAHYSKRYKYHSKEKSS